MKKIILIMAITIPVLITNNCLAWQRGEVRLTPYFGYMFGGDFDGNYPFEHGYYHGKIELDDSPVGGFRVGVGIARGVGLEWQFSAASSAFYAGSPDGFFEAHADKITDVDLYTMQGNITFDLIRGPVTPFFSIGVGATYFDMEKGDSKTRFTGNIAGGVNFRINRHLMFTTEIRGYGIYIREDDDCGRYDCDGSDDIMNNLNMSFGLSFII